MAYTAIARCLNVVAWFTRCGRTVVATRASTNHTAVIEMRRRPRHRGMTKIAARIRCNVINRLTRRRRAVVAARARTHHLCVIDARRRIPCRCRMA